jgi:hypothetical protein
MYYPWNAAPNFWYILCAYVVGSSTEETTYRPEAEKEARVVWLQKSGIVNNQAFESYAIFQNKALTLISTSKRAQRQKLNNLKYKKESSKPVNPTS